LGQAPTKSLFVCLGKPRPFLVLRSDHFAAHSLVTIVRRDEAQPDASRQCNGAGLKLDGPTLAEIYMGEITQWDAAPIKAMNPGVRLPHHKIVPIRRADASGDTFVFSQFLDFSTQRCADKIGHGTTVAWPAEADLRRSRQRRHGRDGCRDAVFSRL
jgi:ABC-type phosphate transport system substrate-binding protein